MPAGDGFLVLLAKGAAGSNQQRCNKMREALLRFYLGEEALSSLRPVITSHSLSTDGLADLISSANNTAGAPAPSLSDHSASAKIVEARIFSMREQRIAAHWYCPVRETSGQRRLTYNADYILDGSHQSRDFAALDLAVFDAALLGQSRHPDGLPFGFTVHATTMQTRRNREAYLSTLAGAPPRLLRRALITVAEIEKGTPLISIAEWCCNLRAIVAQVCLDLHYTDHAISSIGSTGAWAAGFHLPIHSGAQCLPRASRTIDHVRFWSKTLRPQGMRFVVHGIRDEYFLGEAMAAGIDLATSDALWPFAAAPLRAEALS